MPYSIVIPVYNSQAVLPELVERLDKALSKLSGNYEVILVNAGSPDQRWGRNRVAGAEVSRRAWNQPDA